MIHLVHKNMSWTLEDLKAQMKLRLDEITLLEVLGIDAEMLVDRFSDLIEDHFEKLEEDLKD